MKKLNHSKSNFAHIILAIGLILYAAGSARADFTFGTPTKLGPMVNSWSDD